MRDRPFLIQWLPADDDFATYDRDLKLFLFLNDRNWIVRTGSFEHDFKRFRKEERNREKEIDRELDELYRKREIEQQILEVQRERDEIIKILDDYELRKKKTAMTTKKKQVPAVEDSYVEEGLKSKPHTDVVKQDFKQEEVVHCVVEDLIVDTRKGDSNSDGGGKEWFAGVSKSQVDTGKVTDAVESQDRMGNKRFVFDGGGGVQIVEGYVLDGVGGDKIGDGKREEMASGGGRIEEQFDERKRGKSREPVAKIRFVFDGGGEGISGDGGDNPRTVDVGVGENDDAAVEIDGDGKKSKLLTSIERDERESSGGGGKKEELVGGKKQSTVEEDVDDAGDERNRREKQIDEDEGKTGIMDEKGRHIGGMGGRSAAGGGEKEGVTGDGGTIVELDSGEGRVEGGTIDRKGKLGLELGLDPNSDRVKTWVRLGLNFGVLKEESDGCMLSNEPT